MTEDYAGRCVAVWFSCGAASAVAAKRTIELYGERAVVRVVNNPVMEEDPDNRRFLADVEQWIGQPIELVTNRKYPHASAEKVWDHRGVMSVHTGGAPCTYHLKKEARYQWEDENLPDQHVLGFTLDERRRHERFVTTERSNVIPVLIDLGITKADCFDVLRTAGLELPAIYARGYPNANCVGCVKATSPTYWNHVRREHPEIFARRAEQSRRVKSRLVRYRGRRIWLDELPPEAVGKPMRLLQNECSSFCEEK